MIETSHAAMGVAAGCIAIAGEVWYNWTIWTGKTQPDRVAWWVLALSGGLAAGSHLAVGGGWSVVVPLVVAIGMTVSAVLSTYRGVPLALGMFDRMALAVAAAGLGAWVVFGVPLVTLLGLIIVDGAAMAMNIRKAWRLPGSEAPGPWILTVLADVVNLPAVAGSGHGWIFPGYLFLINGMMLLTVMMALTRVVARQSVQP
ncbi:MAG TPA: hypothetical protein VHL31_13945 [Geminicoccus sp.]|jgi:hypothetical protein|uniref:hypothetical protein n=1 Tax=Geminicoccus sp. TaxID=2024832 RepID=UPI002E368667|nr:hypothetical protein [Geminicoccus sp.]HEX2527385.1 hypothetical protein [Geminicoccus sp.]